MYQDQNNCIYKPNTEARQMSTYPPASNNSSNYSVYPLTYNFSSNYSLCPSACNISSNYTQNVPNYYSAVDDTIAEYESVNSVEYEPCNTLEYEPVKKSAAKVKRIMYSNEQRDVLEMEFEREKYLSVERRSELAMAMNVSERQIRIWFQNRRQKEKKNIFLNKMSNNSFNLSHSNTLDNQISQSQYSTNLNENYAYFQSNQMGNQNYVNNSMPFNNNQYNAFDCYNEYVTPMPQLHENENWNYSNSSYDQGSNFDFHSHDFN